MRNVSSEGFVFLAEYGETVPVSQTLLDLSLLDGTLDTLEALGSLPRGEHAPIGPQLLFGDYPREAKG